MCIIYVCVCSMMQSCNIDTPAGSHEGFCTTGNSEAMAYRHSADERHDEKDEHVKNSMRWEKDLKNHLFLRSWYVVAVLGLEMCLALSRQITRWALVRVHAEARTTRRSPWSRIFCRHRRGSWGRLFGTIPRHGMHTVMPDSCTATYATLIKTKSGDQLKPTTG